MNGIVVRRPGIVDYRTAHAEMMRFTDARGADTPDEIWLLEHRPVFTLGLNADRVHLLEPGDIPVEQADRGGQVTYHGPGQLVVYVLLDLDRARLGIRRLVTALETATIATLAGYGIEAAGRRDAPGVYVAGAKIASLGLRVRRHCSYHGLALNVAMNLEPFSRINPCGYRNLQVTMIAALGGPADVGRVAEDLLPHLLATLDTGPRHSQERRMSR
jgi:lipoyl(octanoyl) transferase